MTEQRAEIATQPTAHEREDWVDGAKGIAIILVVLFHAVIFLNDIGLAGPWTATSGPLDTFRMPLFFFTAGLFARKALSMTFNQLVRRRIVRFAWLYVLWTTIWTIAFQFIPLHRDVDRSNPVAQWLLSLVWPNESTWFVYALAVYFCLAWALVRAPWFIQVGVAGVPAILFGANLVDSGNAAVDKMGTYFVFFLLASRAAPRVVAWSARTTWWRTLLLAILYASVTVAIALLDAQNFPGARLVAGLIAVAFGLALSVMLSRLPFFRWLSRLGKRTLPIYFVHFYVVLGAVAILASVDVTAVPAVVWVPAITTLGVLLPLGVESATRRVRWLWSSPFPIGR